jgi:hypothetical protein
MNELEHLISKGQLTSRVPDPRQQTPGRHLHSIFELPSNSWQIVRLVQCRCGGTAARRDGVRVFQLFAWLGVASVKVALRVPPVGSLDTHRALRRGATRTQAVNPHLAQFNT